MTLRLGQSRPELRRHVVEQIVLEGTAEELKESDMFSHYVSMA